MANRVLISLLGCFALMTGCASQNIPNTHVEDTPENREVVDFVEEYRTAMEKRDAAKLLRMASERYYDDMGTPNGDDDVDYGSLAEALKRLQADVEDARYQISYRGVSYVDHERVMVDVLYTGWFKVQTPDGSEWRRRLEPHRLVLARESGNYRILSGM